MSRTATNVRRSCVQSFTNIWVRSQGVQELWRLWGWNTLAFNLIQLPNAKWCLYNIWLLPRLAVKAEKKIMTSQFRVTLPFKTAIIYELQFQVSEILAGDPSKLTKSCTRKSMKQVSGVSRSDVLDTSGHNFFWGGSKKKPPAAVPPLAAMSAQQYALSISPISHHEDHEARFLAKKCQKEWYMWWSHSVMSQQATAKQNV